MSDQNKSGPVGLGHERFHRLTAAEKVIWATSYAEILQQQLFSAGAASRAACVAVKSARDLAGLKSNSDREDHFMLCEVVNLEAALGDEYRKELAPLFGGSPEDVDEELAGVLRWLDHGRFKLAALALRMELRGADLVSEDGRDRDDLVGRLKIMVSAAQSHLDRLEERRESPTDDRDQLRRKLVEWGRGRNPGLVEYNLTSDDVLDFVEYLRGGRGGQAKANSIEYVVFAAPDGTELGLISSRQWEDQTALRRSPSTGRPMTVVARFFAASWDEAKRVYDSMPGDKFDALAGAHAEIARLTEIVSGYVRERTRLDVETTRIQGTIEASKYSHESAFDSAIRLLRMARFDVVSIPEQSKGGT